MVRRPGSACDDVEDAGDDENNSIMCMMIYACVSCDHYDDADDDEDVADETFSTFFSSFGITEPIDGWNFLFFWSFSVSRFHSSIHRW